MDKVSISKELKANYDDYYEKQSDWRWIGSYDKVKNILDLCDKVAHDKIIEIGVGEGSVLKRLSEMNFGKELYGLEVSKSGVEATRQKDISNLVKVDVYDGYNMSYGDDEFDLAILSHVVEHVEYPRLLLNEAIRVAKCL